MTNLPEPIPQAVLLAQAHIAVAYGVAKIDGNLRTLHADIQDALLDLRAETIRELVQDAVKPCPECEFREQGARDYVGRP